LLCMAENGHKSAISEQTLTIESDGPVRIVTLSRPELLNRFDAPLHHDFSNALEEVAADGDARAIVLASTGKVFSAGGDFDLMRSAHADPALRRAMVADAKRLLTTLLSVPQPVVAAMQGAAIGLGATV